MKTVSSKGPSAMTPLPDQAPTRQEAAPGPTSPAAGEQPEDMGYELLLYGHEQVLRGSDNGVLVAFAALAFQQIRGGESEPHYNIGFGFLIFSVLLCGVVHFAMGNVYIGRGRRMIHRQHEKVRHRLTRGVYTLIAWLAGAVQFLCIVLGLLLLLFPDPPSWLEQYVLKYFL